MNEYTIKGHMNRILSFVQVYVKHIVTKTSISKIYYTEIKNPCHNILKDDTGILILLYPEKFDDSPKPYLFLFFLFLYPKTAPIKSLNKG